MKVSIIIPTFNRAKYLTRAVNSALAQDYNDMEVIVSDNDSTDDTGVVVENFMDDKRFKYFKNSKNLGMAPNWRKALNEYATGDFFIILSDDDYLIDNQYISKAVKLINTDPEIVIVYANGYIINENINKKEKLILPFKSVESGKTIFLSRNTVFPQDFCLCNILFKRNLALKLKAFSNDYNVSCDSELFLKMCLYGKVGIIHDPVSVYQLHSDNLLLKMKNDLKLLTNNYDHILEPYKLAKKSDLFLNKELEEWEDRVMVPYMFYILIIVMIFQVDYYNKFEEYLKKKDPDVFNKVHKMLRFKIVSILNRLRLLRVFYNFNRRINLLSKLGDKILFRINT
jgi:glycosyltransferase involved in cell wall biosynthesis